MPLDLLRLKQFVAVAEERNIRRAAQALGITQPTISRGITSLEEQYGCQFFTRNSAGVELTNPGWILLQEAVKILNDVETADRAIRKAVAKERGKAARPAKGRRL